MPIADNDTARLDNHPPVIARGFVVPPPMGSGPWPTCCGKPMWFGPHGYGCWTCEIGNQPPRPVELVEFPVEAGQFALFAAGEAAA
jgi:hypothetical protein